MAETNGDHRHDATFTVLVPEFAWEDLVTLLGETFAEIGTADLIESYVAACDGQTVLIALPEGSPLLHHVFRHADHFRGRAHAFHVVSLPRWRPHQSLIGYLESRGLAFRSGTTEFVTWLLGQPVAQWSEEDDPVNLGLIDASTLSPENYDFLWEHRLAYDLNLLAGDGGVGKGTLSAAIGAAVTRGGPFPDGQIAPAGRVMVLSAEDNATKTILPRWIAAGAALDNLTIIKAQYTLQAKDGTKIVQAQSLTNLDRWRRILKSRPDTSLLIVDPLAGFLGAVDDHRQVELRAALTPWINLVCDEFGIAVLGIAHTGKQVTRNLTHKILGSVTWKDLPRTVHVACQNPEDPLERWCGLAKSNCGPMDLPILTYRIDPFEFSSNGTVIKTSRAVFGKEVNSVSMEHLLAESQQRASEGGMNGRPPVAREKAESWLIDRFRERNEWDSEELFKAAKSAKVARSTLWRARKDLEESTGFPRARKEGSEWRWFVPPHWESFGQSNESHGVEPSDDRVVF